MQICKRRLLIVLICLSTNYLNAQSPVSYPKDTALSAPELNFEVLWHTFEDNYAFFKLRNIDWKKSYNQYRPKVNAGTSDDSLFAVVSSMLAPFKDNHINVIMPGVKQFKAAKPSQFIKEFPTDSLRHFYWTMVNQTLTDKGFSAIQTYGPRFNNIPLFSYRVSKQYGYLRFNRCFVDGDADSKPDAAVAGKILDSIMVHAGKPRGLIIDVRDNMGGNDEFAYEVASRFASRKMVGMYKKTRIRGGKYEDFGKAETWFIEPTKNKAFLKPVVVLTNDKTVSAADVFAMIMKELPAIKIIGTNTCGIYSDMYGFTLPNKWLVSLSNQRYYNNNMVCYEAKGTPVDIKIENKKQDLATMNDPVITAALKILNNK
jgi:carboxyl-terminal processing protease